MAVTPPRTITPPNQTALADHVSYRHRSYIPTGRARGRRSATDYARHGSASPEVINSLISSLDAISRDTKEHFDHIPDLNGAESLPVSQPVPLIRRHRESADSTSVRGTGFGVEYGNRIEAQIDGFPFIDDAAEPPVVHTSKRPSGFSSLTAPKLPKQNSGGSLRSYLRSARSSSSLRSREKGDRSSETPTPSLEVARTNIGSRDSSASRQSKIGSKRLAFMGSKERLRVSDPDWKRSAIDSSVVEGDEIERNDYKITSRVQPRTPSPKKPALAEFIIQEENTSSRTTSEIKTTAENDSPIKAGKRRMEKIEPSSPVTINGHALIPERKSSLHHPHSPRSNKTDSRRSSRRSSLPTKALSSTEGVNVSTGRGRSPPNETEEEKVTRRIRELKEQREKRMRESNQVTVSPRKGSKNQSINNDAIETEKPALDPKALVDPEAHEQQSRLKARKMLGLPITPPPQSPRQQPSAKNSPVEVLSSQQAHSSPTKLVDRIEPESPGFLTEYNKALDRLMGRSSSNSNTQPSSPANSNRNSRQKPDLVTPPKRESSKRNSHRWSQPEHSVRQHDKTLRNSVRDDLLSVRKASLDVSITDGRSSSFDSIDLAVDDFLRDPRLSQKVRHPQTGRTIMFSEVGDPRGYAVFCCVGMGLTRYVMAFYDELATTLKLRLITPDRPGIGGSEPDTDREGTPLSWPGKNLHSPPSLAPDSLTQIQTTSWPSVSSYASTNSPSSPTPPAPSTHSPPHSAYLNTSAAACTCSRPGFRPRKCPPSGSTATCPPPAARSLAPSASSASCPLPS